MKKTTYLLILFLGISTALSAQSKFSYTLLLNQSGSTNDVIDICILEDNGGQCLSFEQTWKTNVTLNVNYQLAGRIRLQSGLGYNILSQEDFNQKLDTNKFRVVYGSIPVRLQYLIINQKVKLYAGLGLRTDIRLNDTIDITEIGNVQDTGRSLAVTSEGFMGLEVPLSQQISLQLEPTFSTALTPYTSEPSVTNTQPNVLLAAPFSLIDKYPSRIGVSFGFTFRF